MMRPPDSALAFSGLGAKGMEPRFSSQQAYRANVSAIKWKDFFLDN
jgi:hypothetical protein